MPRTKRRAASTGEVAATRAGRMPRTIFAQASPHSVGGTSLFETLGSIDAHTAADFESERQIIDQAANRLHQAGFEVLLVTSTTINIAGPQAAYERAFNTRLVTEERPVLKWSGEGTATFVECPAADLRGLIPTRGTDFEDVLEGVAIEEPRSLMAPSAFPPPSPSWHLRVPGDLSLAINADRAHRNAVTGCHVRVALVDSGCYRHPFLMRRGYRLAPVVLGPAADRPDADEVGHGTAAAANILAVAPDVHLLPVKMNLANTKAAFDTAVGLRPEVITCGWGSDVRSRVLTAADRALAASIGLAWRAGITVVAAAGNGQWGFPGQHCDVISAGGVFMARDGGLRASDYASGFVSPVYAGRRVPDLCGLVGMQPQAAYLMLSRETGSTACPMGVRTRAVARAQPPGTGGPF
jgi:Subtilase family